MSCRRRSLALLCVVPLVACRGRGADAAHSPATIRPSQSTSGQAIPVTPCGDLRITASSVDHFVVLTAGHPVTLRTKVGSVISMAATKPVCRNLIHFFGSTGGELFDRTVLRDTGPHTFVVLKPATVTIRATDEPLEQIAGERLNMTLGEVTVVAEP